MPNSGEKTFKGLKNRKVGNPLFKHKQNVHPDENAEIKIEVKRKFKDPLTTTRLVNEGVGIKNRKTEELLNSQSEFHQPSLVRLQVEKKNKWKPSDKQHKK